MTSYDFGDVVLVPFPFTDQSAAKKRPAVVVSSPEYNRSHPDVIVMAITSRPARVAAIGEVLLTRWKEAGLLKPSVVKPVMTTIDKGLVPRALGRLHTGDRSSLARCLGRVLGP